MKENMMSNNRPQVQPNPADIEPVRNPNPFTRGSDVPKLNVLATGVDDVDAAGSTYTAEHEAFRSIDTEWRDATSSDAVNRATGDDAQAFADAHAAGGKDPGPKHANALAARIADLTRQRNGMKIVVGTAAAAYTRALHEQRDDVVQVALGRLDAVRSAMADVVDTLAALGPDVVAAQSFAHWVHAGPTTSSTTQKPRIAVRGEVVKFDMLLDALTEFASAATELTARPIALEDVDVTAHRSALTDTDDVTLDDGRVHPRVASRRAAISDVQNGLTPA